MVSRPFDENIYTSLSLSRLTIFAIQQIVDNNEECAYERVVKECFTLFPSRFSLRRYPDWPDGSRVKIEILRCRDRGWVTGNEKTGFHITSLGMKAAQEVAEALQRHPVKGSRPTHPRDRGDAVIRYLKGSEPFRRFHEDRKSFIISEAEFRRLLVATFETPPRVLKQNLSYCLDICTQYRESELFEFLKECQRQKAPFLKSYSRRRKKPSDPRRRK